ncbi:MAG: PD-(D/E)XK nuclease family protein, partial [Planctomycetales bacterium]
MSIAMNPVGSLNKKCEDVIGENVVAASTDRPAHYISPSRLSLWMRCPRAYEIRYIEGFRSPCA